MPILAAPMTQMPRSIVENRCALIQTVQLGPMPRCCSCSVLCCQQSWLNALVNVVCKLPNIALADSSVVLACISTRLPCASVNASWIALCILPSAACSVLNMQQLHSCIICCNDDDLQYQSHPDWQNQQQSCSCA